MNRHLKRAIQVACAFLGGILIVLLVIPLFGPAWHGLHGNSISYQGWRVHIPAGFYVWNSREHPAIWKTTFGTPLFKVPYAHVTLFSGNPEQPFDLKEIRENFSKVVAEEASRRGFRLISSIVVPVSSRNAYCWQFSKSSKSLVRCAIDGTAVAVFYEGDSRYVPDLFDILRGMSPESPRGAKAAA